MRTSPEIANLGLQKTDAPKVMQLMEMRYQEQSGLRNRDWYTIFFSRLCPADLIVFGINPGGRPTEPDSIIRASTKYYENWEHEYVDCRYAIQEVMQPFLKSVLGANDEEIRHVPKSNLIFRRSPNEDSIKRFHSISTSEAFREAQPTVCEIIKFVSPKMILLEGMKDKKFFQLYCSGEMRSLLEPVKTMYRGRMVRVLDAFAMHVDCLKREIPVVVVGHPSHFGKKPIWGSTVLPAVRDLMREHKIRPKYC